MLVRYLYGIMVVLSILFTGEIVADDSIQEEYLPIGLTPEEMLRLDEIGLYHIRTSPPPGPIRNCAEWEPSEGVIIRWPLGISIDIVAELSEDLMVTTLVSSTYYMNQAISSYTAGGVNMDNTQFVIASTNSIWTRDYGPWFIFDGNDSLAIVDHIYNRPRPLDDQIPWILGDEWDLEVYGMDLIHTGGNHMSDGLGRSMSTRLVYNENTDKTMAEVDSIMLAFLGNDYTVLDYIESSGIHHIDCWAKFLNPTTILVKDVPPSSSSHALLNARADYLAQQISAWEQPYTIVRVYCPSGTAYTNSIILNDKVLVPIFGDTYDDSALATYEAAMPGYEIIGFTGSWLDDDAIHCRTMGVPDRGMLFLKHTPLANTSDVVNDYEVGVKIVAHSGAGLIPDSLKLFYKTKSQIFSWTYLTPTAYPDSFIGYIPAQSAGVTISYYLQAADSSGRVETHPYIGAFWAHQFTIESANLPPQIISPAFDTCAPSPEIFRYIATAVDPNGGIPEISIIDFPSWCEIIGDTLEGHVGCDDYDTSFTIIASDGELADTLEVTLVVDHSNIGPEIISPGDTIMTPCLSPFTYYPDINDPDDSQHSIIYEIYPSWCQVVNDSLVGTTPSEETAESVTVIVGDFCRADTLSFIVAAYNVFICGDADGSGAINILDVTFLINYLYKDGPSPSPVEAADVNKSGAVNILDVTYLINYLYKDGPEPDCQ
nr:agmatine deiminase family protein [candidate division Zixibacteria bacterium]